METREVQQMAKVFQTILDSLKAGIDLEIDFHEDNETIENWGSELIVLSGLEEGLGLWLFGMEEVSGGNIFFADGCDDWLIWLESFLNCQPKTGKQKLDPKAMVWMRKYVIMYGD